MPLRRERGGRISRISPLRRLLRGLRSPLLREEYVLREEGLAVKFVQSYRRCRDPQACVLHPRTPSRSIDYFPPVGRKGRGRGMGRITGAGERGDGKDRREASHFLFFDSIVTFFFLFLSFLRTRKCALRLERFEIFLFNFL